MNLEQILHMVGGSGEYSYANNSSIQVEAILRAKPLVEESIWEICNKLNTDKFVAADLGCSSGPNTFLVISQIIDALKNTFFKLKRKQLEIQYFLNDLPSNDFNNIFKHLMLYKKQLSNKNGADYVEVYMAALPGSFYGRIFLSKSIHLFHSSYSLMWLSQVPRGLDDENCAQLNKGNIYIANASSSNVYDLYLDQFQRDFSEFLRSRSEELIFGGKMILSLLGRKKSPSNGDIFHLWGLLAEALNSMISEGIMEGTKIDAFNLPMYAPLMEEVKSVIEMEGSFYLDQAQTFESNWDPIYNSIDNFTISSTLSGQNVSKYIRAVLEPLISCHFGEDIMEDLFLRYAKNIAKHISVENAKYTILLLALKLKE